MANDMAFPVLDRDQTPNGTYQLGLTKREYAAIEALKGLLSSPECTFYDENDKAPQTDAELYRNGAVRAIGFADALLAELVKEPQS